MEGAHLHLLLNHFPVIGTIISTLVLIAGMVLKNDTIKKTALALVVFTALMTIPAFLSGEDAEEALKAIHQAPRDLIHEHEEMGDIGLWTTLLTGLIAVFGMMKMKHSKGKNLLLFTLVVLIGNMFFLAKIGNAGGMIRHTEIRTTNEPPLQNQTDSLDENLDEKSE